jgi:hypothetical protein
MLQAALTRERYHLLVLALHPPLEDPQGLIAGRKGLAWILQPQGVLLLMESLVDVGMGLELEASVLARLQLPQPCQSVRRFQHVQEAGQSVRSLQHAIATHSRKATHLLKMVLKNETLRPCQCPPERHASKEMDAHTSDVITCDDQHCPLLFQETDRIHVRFFSPAGETTPVRLLPTGLDARKRIQSPAQWAGHAGASPAL